jgi:glycosyltransferase involved in cell wall biosynthesis
MNSEYPIVSAVIPTRNRPGLVVRAVASALEQTFAQLEVIVVVDGPDQATLNALAEIGDARLRVIALDESVGGAEARNTGARAANGKWIALLDDDDEWLPTKIEKQLQMAKGCGINRVVVVSQYLERTPARLDVVRPRRLPLAGEPICEYMFDFLCYFQTSTFFCSRELFLEIPFRKELKSFQDIDWFLRVNSDPSVRCLVIAESLSVYHSPDQRATITSKLDWKKRLAWGQENRKLMTRRAYSRFIVGSCAGTAARDQTGGRTSALVKLTTECLLHGSPTPVTIGFLFGTFLVTPSTRRTIRDSLFLRTGDSSIEPVGLHT